MKCALIMPAWSPEDIFPAGTARLQTNYWQPLGLLYLAAILLRDGHQVRILDGSFLTHHALLAQVRAWRPEFVGITSNTFLWKRAVRTAEDVKAIDTRIFICAGGPHPTALPQHCLSRHAGSIDAVVVGEGELALSSLAARVQCGETLRGIPGVVFRHGDEMVHNGPGLRIADLDTLPFPARRSLEGPHLYLPPPGTYRQGPVATMMTSRGCRNRCIYCFQSDPGERSIRCHSVGRVLDEIEECLQQGYREIRFLDDSFTSDYQRVMEITEGIRSRRLRFSWFASSCVHQVDKPLLQSMKSSGCWSILFGAESGVQKNLNVLKKGTTLGQTRNAVRWAKESGLHVTTPFLIGIPGETYDDWLQTIAFACTLDPHMANFHTLTPFPGTELYEKAKMYGSLSNNFEDYTFQGMAFVPHSMTREEMERGRSLAFRTFYSRPKLLFRKLISARNIQDARNLWLGLHGLICMWKEALSQRI